MLFLAVSRRLRRKPAPLWPKNKGNINFNAKNSNLKTKDSKGWHATINAPCCLDRLNHHGTTVWLLLRVLCHDIFGRALTCQGVQCQFAERRSIIRPQSPSNGGADEDPVEEHYRDGNLVLCAGRGRTLLTDNPIDPNESLIS